MNAQMLYNHREKTAFCSGTDLQDWFFVQVGKMSPSGSVEIDDHAAAQFVAEQLGGMAARNPGGEFAAECQRESFDFAMMAYPSRVAAELEAAGVAAKVDREGIDDTTYYRVSINGKPFSQVAYDNNGYSEMGSYRF